MPSGLSERVTFLSTPEFKTLLNSRALEQQISVAELIRRQFQYETDGTTDERMDEREEEIILSNLIQQVRTMSIKAEKSLDKGLRAIESAMQETN